MKPYRGRVVLLLVVGALTVAACSELWGPLDSPMDGASDQYQGYPTVGTVDEIVAATTGAFIFFPELAASEVREATAYHFQLADSADFSTPLILDAESESNTLVSGAIDLETTEYWWRVRARAGEDDWGRWSATAELTMIPVIDGRSPEDGAVTSNTAPTFDWDDVEGAVGYEIQIAESESAVAGAAAVRVESSEYTPATGLTNNAMHFWRVRAEGSGGQCGFWSAIFTLQVYVSDVQMIIADRYNNRLVRVDDMNGSGWTVYDGSGAYDGITDVAQDSLGRIYFVDRWQHRICRVDDFSGANLTILGGPASGSGVGEFFYPVRIAIDSADRIYVGDNWNHRIVRFDDMIGTNWTALGNSGSGVGQFSYPNGIAIDDAGRIYIADNWNDRIVRIDDMSGAGWVAYELGIGPVGVTVGPDGRVYVADYGHNDDTGGCTVSRLDDMTGAGRVDLGTLGSGALQFNQPTDVAFDSVGRIYITDSGNNRVVRIDDMSGSGWVTYVSSFDRPNAVIPEP